MKLSREYLHSLKPSLFSSWKLGCMTRYPTKDQWMRAGSAHCRDPTLCQFTSFPTVGMGYGCWAGPCPLTYVLSDPCLKFLSSYAARLSFPSTRRLCLKISGWDREENASERWYLEDDNKLWLAVALKSLSSDVCSWKCRIYYSISGAILFLILVFKVQWRGLERLLIVCS